VLRFPTGTSVRPTPDRVRETLFNWLAPSIEGATCLDLFAGTGALGLEALSRGARRVVFVEQQQSQIRQLQENVDLLQCEGSELRHQNALSYLSSVQEKFDVVFLDPPYHQNLAGTLLAQLLSQQALQVVNRVYLETEIQWAQANLESPWVALRTKQAGQVAYSLLTAEL
jgi:16S rRNA (guanine966-N2)-methyltransferase